MPELSLSDVEAVCLILLEIPADKELEKIALQVLPQIPSGGSAISPRPRTE